MPHLHKLSVRQALLRGAAGLVIAACTVDNQGVSGPGEVSQVLVLPESVSIDPGQALQFQAVGLTVSGVSEPVGVRWMATGGGKIDDSGMYTADDHPGHFEVRATLERPNLVASSQVKNRGGLKDVVLNFSAITIPPGGQAQFSASGVMANGDLVPVNVTYSASYGTVTSFGLYTAGQTPGTYRLIATAGSGNKALADTASITINSGASATLTRVVLEPPEVALAIGGTQQFAAYARLSSGDSVAVGVTYSATGGTVTSSGLYAAGQATGTYRVIATQVGGTLADTSTVTIVSGSPTVTSVVLAPASATVAPGATQQFTASARLSNGDSGTVSVAYIANGGTITSAGLYTAGPTAGTYRVIAVQSGGTLADTSSVTITSNPVASVQVSPTDATLAMGTGLQLQVTLKDASGATLSGRSVTWSSSNTAVATVSVGGSVLRDRCRSRHDHGNVRGQERLRRDYRDAPAERLHRDVARGGLSADAALSGAGVLRVLRVGIRRQPRHHHRSLEDGAEGVRRAPTRSDRLPARRDVRCVLCVVRVQPGRYAGGADHRAGVSGRARRAARPDPARRGLLPSVARHRGGPELRHVGGLNAAGRKPGADGARDHAPRRGVQLGGLSRRLACRHRRRG